MSRALDVRVQALKEIDGRGVSRSVVAGACGICGCINEDDGRESGSICFYLFPALLWLRTDKHCDNVSFVRRVLDANTSMAGTQLTFMKATPVWIQQRAHVLIYDLQRVYSRALCG